jgi:tRNA (mo5U34)-methyltransferase
MQALIDSVDTWYHQIEVAPGVITPGSQNSAEMLAVLALPEDLSGQRVLDIGTRDGFFAFQCERRGAEVTAIDYAGADVTGFQVAKQLLGSQVEYVEENVYNLSVDRYGRFDLVLFLGVLYHLRNPMQALDAIRDVCEDRLIVETQMIDDAFLAPGGAFRRLAEVDPELEASCLMQFYPGTSLYGDPTSFWAPNEACLGAMLEATRFAVESQIRRGQRGIAFAHTVEDPEGARWTALDSSVGMWRKAGHDSSEEAPLPAEEARDEPAAGREEPPIPPLGMREMVGPTDIAAFDNPSGADVFPDLPEQAYESVFDFGCGCGRLARQMIQQTTPPRRYLGVDLHPAMITWCQKNLTPHAPQFEFVHHDVEHPTRNPGDGKSRTRRFPAEDRSSTLVIAHSVFTHLIQADAEFYMAEVARILAPSGVFVSTWFLFDKALFPMMQDFQHALYINELDPSNAVIFDRDWLREVAGRNGLTIYAASPPEVRGFHWSIRMTPRRAEVEEVTLPEDEAPVTSERRQAASREPSL